MSGKWKVFAVEIGLGVDQHGQNPTAASVRAVEDAIRRVCIPYLASFIKNGKVKVVVEVGVPESSKVDLAAVSERIPLKGIEKEVLAREGGLRVKGIMLPEYGDRTDEIYIAVAAVTIYVEEG